MSRRRQIYEGKAKILYEGPEPGTLIQYFKDDATAFNAQKRGTISGKGVLNNRISEHIFQALAAIGIRLIDFKLEFGRIWENDYSRVILADEISPDGCRLWDSTTNEKLDKDRFRRDLGGEAEAYQEVARRLGLMPEGESNAVLDLDQHRAKRGK